MDLSLIVSLHLESGPAARALVELGRQSNVDVFWMGDEIPPLQIPAVNGLYSIADGWCAALKGTGLIWERSPTAWNHGLSVRHALPGEYEKLCQFPIGWGPDFIHPPTADWK